MEAWLTSVTPLSYHTWLTPALSRVVTSSTEGTCDPQGGERERRKIKICKAFKKKNDRLLMGAADTLNDVYIHCF